MWNTVLQKWGYTNSQSLHYSKTTIHALFHMTQWETKKSICWKTYVRWRNSPILAGRCKVTASMGIKASEGSLSFSEVKRLRIVALASDQWRWLRPINSLSTFDSNTCWCSFIRGPSKRWRTLERSRTWPPMATPRRCVLPGGTENTP